MKKPGEQAPTPPPTIQDPRHDAMELRERLRKSEEENQRSIAETARLKRVIEELQQQNSAAVGALEESERLKRGLEEYVEQQDRKIKDLESEIERLRDPEREEELERLANHDELTGLLNRRGFKRVAERLMVDVEKKNGPPKEARRESDTERGKKEQKRHDFNLIYIDIDHFKQFNDKWGHHVGDEALKFVAETMDQVLRGPDVVGRWGGEEFVAAIESDVPFGRVKAAERIRRAVESNPFMYGNQEIPITISVGVAKRKRHQSFEELLKEADGALLQAKEGGRNQVVTIDTRPDGTEYYLTPKGDVPIAEEQSGKE